MDLFFFRSIQTEYGIGNEEKAEISQQYMAMASQRTKDVFNVPPYEDLETLADTLLEQEKERLRSLERRVVDGSENSLDSLDSLKRIDNMGDPVMESGNVETKHHFQQPVVGDKQFKGDEATEPGNVENNDHFQQPVVGDNQVNYMEDGEDDESFDEHGEGGQDDPQEFHGDGETDQFKQYQQETDLEGKKR